MNESKLDSNGENIKNINLQKLGLSDDDVDMIRFITPDDVNEAEVVNRGLLSHFKDMQITIRPNSIKFNNACIKFFKNIIYILPMVNRKRKWFLIKACESDDHGSQRWCNGTGTHRKSREITGKDFSERVYKLMNWNKGYYYKVLGEPALQINQNDILFILFDLNYKDAYPMTAKSREKAGVTDEEVGLFELQKIKEMLEVKTLKSKDKKIIRKQKYKFSGPTDEDSFGTQYKNYIPRKIFSSEEI